MGYGSRALELLQQYYEGKFQSLREDDDEIVDQVMRVSDSELEVMVI